VRHTGAALALLGAAVLGRPLRGQAISTFPIPTAGAEPYEIAVAADGSVWFTEERTDKLGQLVASIAPGTGPPVTTTTIREYPLPRGARPRGITAGPEGTIWFTEYGAGKIGRITPAGAITEFALAPGSGPEDITFSSDGLWFTESAADRIGRIRTDGTMTEIQVPAGSLPSGIAAGLASIWFTMPGRSRVGTIGLLGAVTEIADPLPARLERIAGSAGRPTTVTHSAARDGTDLAGEAAPDGIHGIALGAGQGDYFEVATYSMTSWIAATSANQLVRLENGVITRFDLPIPSGRPHGIAVNQNGVVWFTLPGANAIGKLEFGGSTSDATDLRVALSGPGILQDETSFDETVLIENAGPLTGTDVALELRADSGPGASVITSTLSGLSCSPDSVEGSCSLGLVAPRATFRATRTVGVNLILEAPDYSGYADTRAHVRHAAPDRRPEDNTSTLRTFWTDCAEVLTSVLSCPLAFVGCSAAPATPTPQPLRPRIAGQLLAPLAAVSGLDLPLFYRVRDELLARTAAGRRWTRLYYEHAGELLRLLIASPTFRRSFLDTLRAWEPNLRALTSGQGDKAAVGAEQLAALRSVLEELKRSGSPALRATIEGEERALDLPSLLGKDMDAALAQQSRTAPPTVTVPAAASIHGIGGSFFRSDVTLFNPSQTDSATVTAAYRCFAGACAGSPDNAPRSLTVAPGEMRVLPDMVGGFLAAPGSAGAVQVTGGVLVESRVYTGSEGTYGAHVPGLQADEAQREAVLTSLSHSADRTRGFRTNVGVFNPGDRPLSVIFTLLDAAGRILGSLARDVGAASSVQVDDVFGAAGLSTDVDDATCLVGAGGVEAFFAYATVIDNRTQDSIFVPGRGAAPSPSLPTVLPTAASLHGANGTFFHSDVRLFNPSATEPARVTATYRCFTGSCSTSVRTATIGPRQTLVWDDAVASVFGAPESAGPIEVTGAVLADSRVYTPAKPAPTIGLYVPGSRPHEAGRRLALTALASSPDLSRGFRTNVGIFNPNDRPLDVGLTLHEASGLLAGSLQRRVPAHATLQVNDVFAAAGVERGLQAAYALVRANEPVHAYATVIDNRSSDAVFLKGRVLSP